MADCNGFNTFIVYAFYVFCMNALKHLVTFIFEDCFYLFCKKNKDNRSLNPIIPVQV